MYCMSSKGRFLTFLLFLCSLDVNKIEIDKKTSDITIHTRSAGPISRRTHEDNVFDKAKMYAMNTMSYWIAGIGHSWVHFCFMDATAATVHNDLDRSSVLYKLLQPHVLHNNRINWEALGVRGHLVLGGSSLVRMSAASTTTSQKGVPGDLLTKLFTPWTTFPMPAAEFVRNNAKRTTEYYFYSEPGEFACPPKWLEGDNAEIPYIKSVARFYPLVRAHVEKILAEENDAVVDAFIANVDGTSRVEPDGVDLNLSRFNSTDVIASMIYNAVFVHSTDHYFTHEVFRKGRFGIGTIRHPFKRWWYPGKLVPADLCAPDDQLKFVNFADVFVQWNDMGIPIISNCMKYLK